MIGMGFRVGGEDQYLSWVSIEDVIGSIVHCISNDSIAGPVNVVSPNAVTASEFSDAFAKVVGSKIILPRNKSVARIAFGELADELLSASALVKPEKLLSSGYIYSNTYLEQSLRLLLGKPSMSGPE
jgi:NAD dependent epimerase/dehydratase family enzyme